MKTVLLANMGAPVSEHDMKLFLKRMFRDKAIIHAPGPVRFFLAHLISNLRYKSSWKKYLQIGGSPLYSAMAATQHALQEVLPPEYNVRCAYSYSTPLIQDEIAQLYQSGIKDFIVIPMYPQASFSTTGSLKSDLNKAKSRWGDINVNLINDYFGNKHFITFWTKLIQDKIKEKGYSNPYLLFSAHAIPQSFIKRGDMYTEKINTSAQLISEELHLPYSVSYQSKIGKIQWTKPYTMEQLADLHKQNISEIIIVPFSFINENLETKYDLDTEIIPYAINKLGIKDICRIHIPASDSNLVEMFSKFILRT